MRPSGTLYPCLLDRKPAAFSHRRLSRIAMTQVPNDGYDQCIPGLQNLHRVSCSVQVNPNRNSSGKLLCSFFLGKHFQAGLQLAAGELLLSMFFWRSELRYTNQCLCSTLYLLCSLLIPMDSHMGSKLVSSALLVGSASLASVLAGSVVRFLLSDLMHSSCACKSSSRVLPHA